MSEKAILPAVAAHGATHLPSVDLDSYKRELKNDEGLCRRPRQQGRIPEIIHNWRKRSGKPAPTHWAMRAQTS